MTDTDRVAHIRALLALARLDRFAALAEAIERSAMTVDETRRLALSLSATLDADADAPTAALFDWLPSEIRTHVEQVVAHAVAETAAYHFPDTQH